MKRLVKSLANLAARVATLPAYLAFRLTSLFCGQPRAFPFWTQSMSLLPGTVGAYLRRAFYGQVFPAVGKDVMISFGTIFSHPTASLGDNVYVGAYCVLGDVELGNDVLLGSQVSIMNGARQHGIERLDIPVREQPGEWPRIRVGQDTWIGDRAVVMADIGNHCVVGAGSVVTKPLPDYAIAVGNPARVIRYRNALSPVRKVLNHGAQA